MTEPAKSEVTETEEVDVSAFDLNIHVHRLLMDEPFFAALSRRMDTVSYTHLRAHET